MKAHEKIQIGDVFTRLTVMEAPYKNKKHVWHVKVKCSCGNIKQVRVHSLLNGHTLSCGCLGAEKRGAAKGAKTHGMTNSPEYTTLRKMKERCYSKNCPEYSYYGGRGIKICDRWLEPNGQGMLNFYTDMGPRPSKEYSIDRIDVNGDYTPENCRWTDIYTQANNKRSNNYLTFNGETKTLTTWANELGIEPKTLFTRIYDGWGIEKALSTPTIKPKTYSLGEKELSLKEWSEEINIPLKTLEMRLSTGWSIEDTFSKPLNKPKTICYNGECKTIKEWVENLPCTRVPIEKRIRNGMEPVVALKEVLKKYS